MNLRLICLCLPLAVTAADAVAEGVYLCTQPSGTREYRNTGDTRGCRKLDLESISTIPSPPPPQVRAAVDPSFPRIESQIQKRRDQDRMLILQEEMRAEESKLSQLRREYQNGEPERQGSERNYAKYQERVALMKDEMTRTEKNIEALRREMGQLK